MVDRVLNACRTRVHAVERSERIFLPFVSTWVDFKTEGDWSSIRANKERKYSLLFFNWFFFYFFKIFFILNFFSSIYLEFFPDFFPVDLFRIFSPYFSSIYLEICLDFFSSIFVRIFSSSFFRYFSSDNFISFCATISENTSVI